MRIPETRRVMPHLSFLENLYTSGLVRDRRVPAESGVQFFVHANIQKEGICLIFCLDWGGPAPLITDENIKPDYLVLFIPCAQRRLEIEQQHGSAAGWYCTLVELKGRESKNLKHGVEQLEAGWKQMKEEFRAFSPQPKIQWQGILLHPENADVPHPMIEKLCKNGLPTLAVQGHHQ